MIYPIVKYGDPVLEKSAEPVTKFDKDLEKLVADMFETMYAAQGVGLAAPQIGISKQLCVIDVTFDVDPDARLVLANPEIISRAGKKVLEEGCLSVPGLRAEVTRAEKVTVRAQDLHGRQFTLTGEGLLARAFAHEVDHLNGSLFFHHLSPLKRESFKRRVRRLQRDHEW